MFIFFSVLQIFLSVKTAKSKMAADDDGDVFEITDFTTASEWERFISRVEEILHEWKLVTSTPKSPAPKGSYTTGAWEEKTSSLKFADFNFTLTHIWLQWRDERREKSSEKESGEEEDESDIEVTPTVYGDLMNMDNDFPSRAHCVCRWYGVQDFVTLVPAGNTEAVLGESRMKILVSSVNIALSDAGCIVPVFVQIHQKWRRLYQGTCILPGSSVEFGMVHLKRTPPQYNHLAGLLDVFKAKLGTVVDHRPPVSVAVRFLYMLYEWVNAPWSQPLPDFDGEVGCSGFDKLPFGACEDPVSALNLYCTWPSLSEDMIVENQVYSDLDPLQAPLWSVRVQMTEDPQCLLGEYLSQFLALCHRQETLEQLLGGLGQEMRQSDSTGDISTALQRLTEPQLSYNMPSLSSYVAHPPKQGAVKPTLTPIEGDMLTQILQHLFPDSVKPMSGDTSEESGEETATQRLELPRQLKSAPVESLLYRFAITLCVLNHNNGGILAVAQMWQEFVLEMRYRWEHSHTVVGVEQGPPNLGSCILQQKLQMLNCCIEHKKKREQLHKGYTGEIQSPSSPFRGPSTSQVSRSMSHDECMNITDVTSINSPLGACAIEEEVTGNDACDKNNQSYSKNRNGVKNRNKGSAIRTNEKRDSQRLASSGESSDDEFFECNDDEANQSDEKDVDTTSENRNKSQGTTSEQTTEGEEMEDNENQTENEIDCQDEDQTGLEGDENREASSENPDLTGSQTTQDTNSLSNVSVVSDTQYKESYSHSPEGRLATFQDLRLINCDDRMYIPVTQEPAPMTEDMLEEHAEVLAKLGTSAEGAELRARMQSACLLSDMESFKAANPGCVLDDFVRWYSPRDWIEEQVEDEHGNLKTEGQLSVRMQIPGNMWVEVWQTARPVPARRQKRLFDDTKEAEKVLHYLSSLKPSDVVVLLMPMLIHAALLKAMENEDKDIPVLKQAIEQACNKASQVTRAPQQDAKRYEECIRMIMQAEVIIARSLSLKTKFTSELLEHRDATTELQVFVRSVLQNSEVTIRGGPMGPAGSVITKLFQSAMRASYMILDDDDTGTTQPSLAEEDSTHNSSVPNFPRPLAREYILRTILPRPAPYSRTLPQRMYCCIEEDEFRLAGAFSSDTVFQ
ncbi:rab3 GTPase-activating protein catalytic subunit-like isoform X2 [Mya arenaria]|uniref:rab3 GTPase-activating protein catalytic subunit-like isoform X2 n=1 Tax=Mya arenaria TaxID=6604 RepID=UPI0022E1A45E|nr:rab3 GTPase-activating protein catalytic subunit-like isoform X2 [Mya arenaria]